MDFVSNFSQRNAPALASSFQRSARIGRAFKYIAIVPSPLSDSRFSERQIQHRDTRRMGLRFLRNNPRESHGRFRDRPGNRCRLEFVEPGVYLSSGPRRTWPAYRKSRRRETRSRASAVVARQRKVDCTIACGRITAYIRATCAVHAAGSRPHRALGETKVPRDITLGAAAGRPRAPVWRVHA